MKTFEHKPDMILVATLFFIVSLAITVTVSYLSPAQADSGQLSAEQIEQLVQDLPRIR